ncbi:hypothetical protein N7537_000146 [Penicillium hordei]|uniref:Uncharacterized protein n=1 Tax=Penicillium hordei TaxID=40994 RepID=A0AAD6H709_9EURO|nr:uncharacterized protein N7537_000146 [Penicillium hordei]KAJ5615032.1 hypothetical protein N7537_000146 [Penicillium hordei]
MITITVDPQSSAILLQAPLIPVFGCPPTSMSTSTPPLTQNPTHCDQALAPEDNSYSPAEETGHHSIGAPLKVPSTDAGGDLLAPSPWATYKKRLPWKVAGHGNLLKPTLSKSC